jgi:DNA-binding winged helix-turn-helix (wHTH) protein
LLKQLVHRLRQRIGDASDTPRWIETLPGVGYRLLTGGAAGKNSGAESGT